MSVSDKITRLQNAKTSIKNAVSGMGGTVSSTDGFEDFASDILTIPQGIVPSGTKSITENGTYDVTNFANALVNVSGGSSPLELIIDEDFTTTRDITNISTPTLMVTLDSSIFVNKFTSDDLYLINTKALYDVPGSASNFYQKFCICSFGISDAGLPVSAPGCYVGLGIGFTGTKWQCTNRAGLSYVPQSSGNQNIYAQAGSYCTTVKAGTYKLRIWKLPQSLL